jgi:hypothetical protein
MWDDGLNKESTQPVIDMPGLAFANGQASVTTIVTLRAVNSKRRSILITNLGPDTLYVGAAGVTSANGMPVYAAGNMVLNSSAQAAIFAISGGTSDTRFLEELVS